MKSSPDASDPPGWPDTTDWQEGLIDRRLVDAVDFHEEIGSTNDLALYHARSGDAVLPRLIVAGQQTAGRGRGANRWHAGQGALTFSILIDPALHGLAADRWPLVSLAAAMAIAESVESLALLPESCQLKWPNDVYLTGKKLAGILVEVPSGRPPRMVVGIGMNVNNSLTGAPPDVQARAISLADMQSPLSLPDVLAELLKQFRRCISELADGDGQSLLEAWRPRCLLTGKTVRINQSGNIIVGLARGLDASGALLVEHNGQTQPCHGGVVEAFE